MMQKLRNGMSSHFTSGLFVTIKLSLPPPPPPSDGVLLQWPCPVTTSRHPPYGEQWVLRNIIPPPPIKRNLWDGEGLPNLHSYSLLCWLYGLTRNYLVCLLENKPTIMRPCGVGESWEENRCDTGDLSYCNLEHEDKWTFNCGSLIFYGEMRGSLKWR